VVSGDLDLFTHEPNRRNFRWSGIGPPLIGIALGFRISGMAHTSDD